jgi:hypothetical protein
MPRQMRLPFGRSLEEGVRPSGTLLDHRPREETSPAFGFSRTSPRSVPTTAPRWTHEHSLERELELDVFITGAAFCDALRSLRAARQDAKPSLPLRPASRIAMRGGLSFSATQYRHPNATHNDCDTRLSRGGRGYATQRYSRQGSSTRNATLRDATQLLLPCRYAAPENSTQHTRTQRNTTRRHSLERNGTQQTQRHSPKLYATQRNATGHNT